MVKYIILGWCGIYITIGMISGILSVAEYTRDNILGYRQLPSRKAVITVFLMECCFWFIFMNTHQDWYIKADE